MKLWDANAEHRPTAKELYKILKELHEEDKKFNNEIRCQMRECYRKLEKKKLKNRSNENKSENIKLILKQSIQSNLYGYFNNRSQ
ncbi:hypothetical protein C1646_756195 [Rhizophagus diaphanus]|nr:hypothetical protein C1646_756195 [Rhizophagus diaphanus] [Rhizophagus sp. MUCL 43196]